MSALPKLAPITTLAVERPAYRGYWLVRTNRKAEWIDLNADLLAKRYWDFSEPDWGLADLIPFADSQFDVERERFEEMKADAKFDDGRLSEEV